MKAKISLNLNALPGTDNHYIIQLTMTKKELYAISAALSCYLKEARTNDAHEETVEKLATNLGKIKL